MILTKKQGGNFTPHDEGSFRAVCVDVTPLTKQQGQYGEREVFQLVFETDAPARGDGSPQAVWSRRFTASLNEKANFRKFLRQWFGRDLTPAEEAEFDTESLIGKPASVVVTHEAGEGETVFANIVACTKCLGEPLQPSGKFVRKMDRDNSNTGGDKATYRGAASAPAGQAEAGEAVDATAAGSDWTKVKVHVGRHSGVELRDLDTEAITKLVNNWLPVFKTNAKPTADDKRLAAALEKAAAAIAEPAAEVETAY